MSAARRSVASLPLFASLVVFLVLGMIALPSRAADVDRHSRGDAERLSTTPEITLDQGVCHVRGAVWLEGKGPQSNEEVTLIDRAGQIHAIGLTDRWGIYEVEIVFPDGKGLVLKEQDYVRNSRGLRTLTRGASVICAKPKVEIGTVEKLM